MSARSVILTVDHNTRNLELLRVVINKEGYQTHAVSTLEEFDQVLLEMDVLGLALVDISGFDRRIWDYCEKLTTHGVPIFIISPKQVSRIQQESFSHGVQGVLFKPLVIKELISVIQAMIREE